jgi:NifU-like protein involved in Fe-S cluster formation
MDQAVVNYYRKLILTNFRYAGVIQNADITVNAAQEGIAVCGKKNDDPVRIYLKTVGNIVEDAKYLCMCDPVTQVAVEILCELLPGKSLETIKAMKPDAFLKLLEGESAEFTERAKLLIQLINKGIERYQSESTQAS